MKDTSVVPASLTHSVSILRIYRLDLDAGERLELHRSEVALGRVFKRIHRIEWRIAARGKGVGLRCEVRS